MIDLEFNGITITNQYPTIALFLSSRYAAIRIGILPIFGIIQIIRKSVLQHFYL